ncbi:MAG TPA: hypothetical protein VMU32_08590 [Solirubrobacteraceae bacterium]|nr:hypothetical protein [Solirubrobacteraceae bacterium]
MNGKIDVGAVLRRTFQIYVDQAPVLMPTAAVVFVISGVFGILLVVASPALAILALIVSLVATILYTGMIVELVADVRDGKRDATVGQLLRAVSPVLGQLILVAILAAVGEAIGFVLLIVPGLILLTIWAVAAPVVVLEHPGAMRALGRSRELVRGNGWQVFGVILLLVIGIGVVTEALYVLANAAGTTVGLIVRVVLGILTAPISALAAAVLYFELRDSAHAGGDLPERADSFQTGPFPPAAP